MFMLTERYASTNCMFAGREIEAQWENQEFLDQRDLRFVFVGNNRSLTVSPVPTRFAPVFCLLCL